MTTTLNLYGGPGAGKSTLTAYAYYLAKKAGVNVEMVREYVKEWVWEGRSIGPLDQIYIMAKHMRKESVLHGKVDLIVTDSPIILPILYARMYSPASIAAGVQAMVKEYSQTVKEQGHKEVHVMLERKKAYRQEGRFQTEAEAKALDVVTKDLLDELGIIYTTVDGTEQGIKDLLLYKGLLA